MFEGVDHEREFRAGGLRSSGLIHSPVANLDAQKAKFLKSANLVPETGADGDALASFSATTRKNRLSALGLHPRTETVGLGPATAVRLKCTFRHETGALLLENDCIEQTVSIRE
jgi:hypothetical protein